METYLLKLAIYFLSVCRSTEAVCNFGAGCPFSCRCQNNEKCNPVTGRCQSGVCEVASPAGYGWSGYGCLTGNVARGKPASQNGVYGGRSASLAVDDILNVDHKADCAHTDAPRAGSPSCPTNDNCSHSWWQVDLEQLHRISGIIIFNVKAEDEYFRMNHIRLYVSNTSRVLSGTQCDSFSQPMYSGENRTFTCTRPLIGRYVTLYKYDTTNNRIESVHIFTVCEVVVIGNLYNNCTGCTFTGGVCTEQYGCVSCDGLQNPEKLCNTVDVPPNLAYEKRARQNGVSANRSALLAVDGDVAVSPKSECAHVSADPSGDPSCVTNDNCNHGWWQVDLGQLYTVTEVTIYNVDDNTESSKMNNIEIYVSTVSRVKNAALCYWFTQSIGRGQRRAFNCSQPVTGRYVTLFKTSSTSNNSDNIQMFSPCEVVVRGVNIHGDCPNGKFGTDCTPCGNCLIGVQCDKVTGACPGGCQQWWLFDLCNEEIERPTFNIGANLGNNRTASLFVAINWGGLKNIKENLRIYYGYQIQYRLTNPTGSHWITYNNLKHTASNTYTEAVRNLKYNTEYEFRVRPYRTDRGVLDYGTAITTKAKTKCVAPGKPAVTRVQHESSGSEKIQVNWQLSAITGCDFIQKVTVHYRLNTVNSTRDYPGTATSAVLEVDYPGEYRVHIVVHNNQGLYTSSDTREVSIYRIVCLVYYSTYHKLLVRFTLYQLHVISQYALRANKDDAESTLSGITQYREISVFDYTTSRNTK